MTQTERKHNFATNHLLWKKKMVVNHDSVLERLGRLLDGTSGDTMGKEVR